jgi:hypothetical protein
VDSAVAADYLAAVASAAEDSVVVADYPAAVASAAEDSAVAADYPAAVASAAEDFAVVADYPAAEAFAAADFAVAGDYPAAVASAAVDSVVAAVYPAVEASVSAAGWFRLSSVGAAEDSSFCLCRPAEQRQSPASSKAKAAKATLQTPSAMGSSDSWFSPQFSPQSQDCHSIATTTVECTERNKTPTEHNLRLSSAFGKIHCIYDAEYGHIDWGIRPSDGRHCGKTFGNQKNAIAHTGVHGIKRQYRFAAIATIQLQRLHNQNLPSHVRRSLLRRNYVANHFAYQHKFTILKIGTAFLFAVCRR